MYASLKDYSRQFAIIFKQIHQYYERDPDANSISKDILLGILQQKVTNKKHYEEFALLVEEASNMNTSTVNMDELILSAKKNEVGFKLASALTNKEEGVFPLIEEYTHLHNLSTLEELGNSSAEVITFDMIDSVFDKKFSKKGTLTFYPLAIDQKIEGRLHPEDHVVVFGRPNIGKSAFNITASCGFARQGAKGIYFINEDAADSIYPRLVYNLAGMSVYDVEASTDAYRKARDLAYERGLENIILIKLSPGTLQEMESYIDKLSPAWIITDQMRNLSMKGADSKTLQLEYATSGIRNLASKYRLIALSVTQAGDSAEGKSVLGMGDVDFSNTGVAAQCDLMLGIGASEQQIRENIRVINICKNKLTGWHGQVITRIDPLLSRYLSSNNNNWS